MADFATIVDYGVTFNEHPMCEGADKHLNNIHSDYLVDYANLFTDATVCDTVKDDRDLLSEVRKQIVRDVIVPNAAQTANPGTLIPPLFQNASMSIDNRTSVRRLNKRNLTRSLTEARTNGQTWVYFRVNITHLHIDVDNVVNCLDWARFGTVAFAGAAPVVPTAHPSAADIALAVAGAIPSAADVATAVATAVACTGGTVVSAYRLHRARCNC